MQDRLAKHRVVGGVAKFRDGICGAAPGSARFLVILTPGGFEGYFDELAEVLRSAGGVPEPTALVELGIAYGSVPA